MSNTKPIHEFSIIDQEYGEWGETYYNGEPRKTYRDIEVGRIEARTERGALQRYAKQVGLYGWSHLRAHDLTDEAEREAHRASVELKLELKKLHSGYTIQQFEELKARDEQVCVKADEGRTKLRNLQDAIERLESTRDRVADSIRNIIAGDLDVAINRLEEEKPGLIDSTRALFVELTELREEQERVGIRAEHDWYKPNAELVRFDYEVSEGRL